MKQDLIDGTTRDEAGNGLGWEKDGNNGKEKNFQHAKYLFFLYKKRI